MRQATPAVAPAPFGDRGVAASGSGQPSVLVVALHGYGSTGDTLLARLADAGVLDRAGALVVAPDGPAPAHLRPGGRQWYPITNMTALAVERSTEPGARLRRWVLDCQARTGLAPSSTVVVGFSQGGIMAEVLAEPPAVAAHVMVLASAPGGRPVDPSTRRTYVVGSDDRFVSVATVSDTATAGDSVVEIPGLGHDTSDRSLAHVLAVIDTVAAGSRG